MMMEFKAKRSLNLPWISYPPKEKNLVSKIIQPRGQQLSQMLKQQKLANNLEFRCELDKNKQMNCRWLKVSSR